MALEKHILTRTEPTIELDDLEFKSYGEEDGEMNSSKDYGAGTPFLRINGYDFEGESISTMLLNLNGIIPTIDIAVIDKHAFFAVENYPRSGDVMSLRIASRQPDTFKDIRIDFDIESVISPVKRPEEHGAGGSKYTFKGVMKIPGYYAEQCKSYGTGSVLTHLEAIATDMSLGYASNIDTSHESDSMNLLIAYQTVSDVVSNTVLHSYIGEDSFQTFFIDPYYYLTFVDVNAMINSENTIDETFTNFEDSLDESIGDEDKTRADLILTNIDARKGTNLHISKYAIKYGSGKVARKFGYKRVVQFYENEPNSSSDTVGMVSNDIEALSSSVMRDIEEPLKGRRGEERYLNEIKYKYVGRSSNSTNVVNMHPNYLFAEIQNTQNMAELSKLQLEVELDSYNPGIYRYQKVPVVLYSEGFSANSMAESVEVAKEERGFDNMSEGGKDTEKTYESGQQSVDSFLSAHYIVGGIQILYKASTGKLTQKLTLLRREWPTRVNNLENTDNPPVVTSTPQPAPEPTPEPTPEPEPAPVIEPSVTSSISSFNWFIATVGEDSSAQLITVSGSNLNGESITVEVPGGMMMIIDDEYVTRYDAIPDGSDSVNINIEVFLEEPVDIETANLGNMEISGGGQFIEIPIDTKVNPENPIQSEKDSRFEHFYTKTGFMGNIQTRRVSDQVVVIVGQKSSGDQLELTDEAEWLLEDGLANGTII